MEKCFNCGAEVRPGAKFCTSCGTRLVDNPAAPASEQAETSSWSATPAEQTQVATPATDQADDDVSFASWRRANKRWDTDQSGSTSDDDETSPADRFEAALDANEQHQADEAQPDHDYGWGSPAPASDDRFASWSAAYGTTGSDTSEPQDADTGDHAEGEVVAVETATAATGEPDAPAPDAAGFTEGGEHEVDYLSGDENIEAGGPDSGIAAGRPSDASDDRQRATNLVEELRELIWKIGEQEPAESGDTTDVRNALSTVRGQTGDFSDLEGAISAVRESPRDIDALRELGSHAGRLEELLESHGRLTAALDDAIRKLNG